MSLQQAITLPASALLPAAWRGLGPAEAVRVFNPALLADGGGWILAYRVVGADGARRIGFCRLGSDFSAPADAAVAFSDHVRFPERISDAVARTWFADPRLYRIGLRTFVYWNSGWHEPRNFQFLQEFDPVSLLPLGEPKELLLEGPRQPLEKNWTFFTHQRDLLGVYSVTPHRILRVTALPTGDLLCQPEPPLPWDLGAYPTCHGGLRGGTPPMRLGDDYWSVVHSVHDAPDGYRYAAAAYAFEARPPFAPSRVPTGWLPLPLIPRTRAKLNPAVGDVTYPCGAAIAGESLAVSYGCNDESAAIAVLDRSTLLAFTRPAGK